MASPLDREAEDGTGGNKVVHIVAVDTGVPSLSSTATLHITLIDVNDCPPRLSSPTVLHIAEDSPAAFINLITAEDDDVWALGHGPPFNFSLASTNAKYVTKLISLKYVPSKFTQTFKL